MQTDATQKETRRSGLLVSIAPGRRRDTYKQKQKQEYGACTCFLPINWQSGLRHMSIASRPCIQNCSS